MANYIRKFETTADYEAATLQKPAVSLIETSGEIKFDPDVYNGIVRVYYNVTDPTEEVVLYGGGESGSESGSESEVGGATPIDMWIDGVLVAVVNTYRFDTAGLHYVDYAFDDSTIPDNCFSNNDSIVKVVIVSNDTYIGYDSFTECSNLAEVISKPTTPPVLNNPTFNYATAIYVPSASVNDYKADEFWGDYYSSIIQAM